MSLKFELKRLLQLLSEYVDAAPGQFVVQIGDDKIERNLNLDMHRDGGELAEGSVENVGLVIQIDYERLELSAFNHRS